MAALTRNPSRLPSHYSTTPLCPSRPLHRRLRSDRHKEVELFAQLALDALEWVASSCLRYRRLEAGIAVSMQWAGGSRSGCVGRSKIDEKVGGDTSTRLRQLPSSPYVTSWSQLRHPASPAPSPVLPSISSPFPPFIPSPPPPSRHRQPRLFLIPSSSTSSASSWGARTRMSRREKGRRNNHRFSLFLRKLCGNDLNLLRGRP